MGWICTGPAFLPLDPIQVLFSGPFPADMARGFFLDSVNMTQSHRLCGLTLPSPMSHGVYLSPSWSLVIKVPCLHGPPESQPSVIVVGLASSGLQ